MTDLDTTEIISADDSLTENASTNDTKASLKILSGTDSNTFQLNNETIVGRSSPSDAIIPAPSLSKQHAKITINNGKFFITDLGSSNKTLQNKVQLQPNVCYALHDGDEIKFGDVICSFQEQKQTNTAVETKIDMNPSTQTISNSYDEQEPTQPMKVWNKNNNDTNDPVDVPLKQNGINDSSNKSSSPHPLPTTSNDDDNNLIIDSTTSPATVPLVVEPEEMKNDDQPDTISSPRTKNNLLNETPIITEIEDTPSPSKTVEDTTHRELVNERVSEEQMDTESPPMVIDDQQSENGNGREDEIEKSNIEGLSTSMEQESAPTADKSLTTSEEKITTGDVEKEPTATSTRGVARRNVHRARGRGAAARVRVVSTRLHGGRRNAIVPPTIKNEENDTTIEESPEKSIITPEVEEKPSKKNDISTPNQSNVRASARIKDRASSGRTRQFPYADDYVNLDDLEKQSKASTTTARKSNRGRPSTSPQKRISLREQPIDVAENSEQKSNTNIYEDIDTITENKEPTPKTAGRKRKSTTPVSAVDNKRSRPTTPQTVPTMSTRRKQTSTVEQSPTVAKPGRRTTGGQQPVATPTTPKRGRKSTKVATPAEQSPEEPSSTTDRPVRIALSSHLNFDQNHIDILRKIGFEIMDESCHVDALVVDRIRRTKKFFMCLARGAHILSPTWIEAMIKENRYIPYDKYYLEDKTAETRYGFQLRESVHLAKNGPIFANYKFFCTKDTSPPYDDLKDIIEAAGGKLIEKINMNRPGKDMICIVAQIHKNEYEDLFKKGISIVSEEFILSGISKQKLDFDSFSLFQNATTVKPTSSK